MGDKRQSTGGSSKAALVWLIVALIIGGLLLFKNTHRSSVDMLKQSDFEDLLKKNQIKSAVIVNDSENIYDIEGKYEQENDKNQRDYRTKVIYSPRLAELLKDKQYVL